MSAKWTWNKCFTYPKSKRQVLEGLRHYDVVDGLLPSVTTILSDTKSEEKIKKLADNNRRMLAMGCKGSAKTRIYLVAENSNGLGWYQSKRTRC